VENAPHSDAGALADFDQQPLVARLETDRFCDQCGYNLHSQAVRRDARTGLLLCRCPECGRFHSARDGVTVGRVWRQRIGTLALFAWVLTILGASLVLALIQVGIAAGTLDELTTYCEVPLSAAGPLQPAERARISPAESTVWRQQPRELTSEYIAFLWLMYALAAAVGWAFAMLLVVTMHHWRRVGYLVPVTLLPAAVGAIIWYIWSVTCPHLSEWGAGYILRLAGANLAGGVLGVCFGRPLARLVVTLVLPPRIRQVLAFLWLADGKPPPTPLQ
jgi:hypothetical protein